MNQKDRTILGAGIMAASILLSLLAWHAGLYLAGPAPPLEPQPSRESAYAFASYLGPIMQAGYFGSFILGAGIALGLVLLFPRQPRTVVLAEKPPRTKLRGKPLRGSLTRKHSKGA